ncbi:MAG: 3-deoxy-D-manno-octulosonic acid transferase [Phycisphaerae bacterium]|nr:3-deoxy-D-manno-octulosonic acid transferase [Phycisphaerae bacterium]
MGLLLDIGYVLGLTLGSPLWIYRMIRHGRYRSDIAQRLGAVPIRYGLQPVIWVHGVSLGEVNAARTLVEQLHEQLPDFRVVVSSTTDTGMAAARRLFAPDHQVFRWPMDFSLAVGRALERLRPALVVLMEGEFWPNFLAACNRRGIPAVVVNGRISPDKGYRRYKLLGPLAGRLFNRLAAIGVQEEVYAERFRSLGADPGKVCVTGMMKFDTITVADHLPAQEVLAAALGLRPNEPLLVAGGTGPGEEHIVLGVYARLRARHGGLRLAIVPRKPERFDEVARLIESAGHALVRRSAHPDGATGPTPPAAVILGDTMGELRKFYALAACVFVGRSLVPMGGSDMIESAALGRPTAFGPHTFNFPQADDLARCGCRRVADAAELEAVLDQWLRDADAAAAAGRQAQAYVRSQQGATRRNVEMICRVLNRTPAAPGGIATDVVEADTARPPQTPHSAAATPPRG